MQTDAPDHILRLRTELERTGLSRTTLYRVMQDSTFPKHVRISMRCVGWRQSAINAWSHNPMFWSVHD